MSPYMGEALEDIHFFERLKKALDEDSSAEKRLAQVEEALVVWVLNKYDLSGYQKAAPKDFQKLFELASGITSRLALFTVNHEVYLPEGAAAWLERNLGRIFVKYAKLDGVPIGRSMFYSGTILSDPIWFLGDLIESEYGDRRLDPNRCHDLILTQIEAAKEIYEQRLSEETRYRPFNLNDAAFRLNDLRIPGPVSGRFCLQIVNMANHAAIEEPGPMVEVDAVGLLKKKYSKLSFICRGQSEFGRLPVSVFICRDGVFEELNKMSFGSREPTFLVFRHMLEAVLQYGTRHRSLLQEKLIFGFGNVTALAAQERYRKKDDGHKRPAVDMKPIFRYFESLGFEIDDLIRQRTRGERKETIDGIELTLPSYEVYLPFPIVLITPASS